MVVFVFILVIFKISDPPTFQTIWFSYSIVSNLIGMHIIRTAKMPFIQSNANKMVYFSSILLSLIGILVPYTGFGHMIGLVSLPIIDLAIILGVPILYCIVAIFAKKFYIKKFGEWI